MSKVEMGEEQEIADDESEQKTSSAVSRLNLSSSSLKEALSSSSSMSLSLREQGHDDKVELKWAAIERLPTLDRLHTDAKANADALEPVDVRSLGAAERQELVHTLITDIPKDNLRLLRRQRRRMDRVGVRQPTVEVRWQNVRVEAECQVVDGKPLPTLLNSTISTLSLLTTMLGFKRNQERIHILKDVTGILKPSRMTLLLGPPGCGKTSLLQALAGKLNKNLKVVLFMLILYPMVGYTWTVAKFFWFMYTMFCTLLYFLYMGMMMVSLTPNIQIASVLASMFYSLQNLMSGFIVPRWWIWLYYISPMSWTLNIFFTTQFGDDNDRMVVVFGETKSVAAFIRDYFGFRRDLLPLAALALAAFPILFAVLFGYNISKLNFQRR